MIERRWRFVLGVLLDTSERPCNAREGALRRRRQSALLDIGTPLTIGMAETTTLRTDSCSSESFTVVDSDGSVVVPPGSAALWAEDGRSRKEVASAEPLRVRTAADMVIVQLEERVHLFLVFGRWRLPLAMRELRLALRERVASARWRFRR